MNRIFKVELVREVKEGAGSIDHSRSALGDSLDGSRDNPIVLLEDNESNASDFEEVDSSLRAESARPDVGSETAVDLRLPASFSNPEGCHEIERNDFADTAQRFQFQEDRLHTGRSITDEHGLVHPVLYTNTFNEKRQQRQQQEEDYEGEDNSEDESQPQQKVGETHLSSKGDESARPAKRQRPLPYGDSSPEPSHDEAGSHGDNYSDDELNNTKAKSGKDDERPCPAKRKQPFLSYDGLTQ
ncbi:MAG: hypothetical protein M1840_002458 [Geoglossum simile]|nr:MAG: hypothetical protein M1840_002458 [Geoglossum simile]